MLIFFNIFSNCLTGGSRGPEKGLTEKTCREIFLKNLTP
jgi:hypothetical protein